MVLDLTERSAVLGTNHIAYRSIGFSGTEDVERRTDAPGNPFSWMRVVMVFGSSGPVTRATRARCKRVCKKEASVMTEQRTDHADQDWTIEAPENVEEDDEGAAL